MAACATIEKGLHEEKTPGGANRYLKYFAGVVTAISAALVLMALTDSIIDFSRIMNSDYKTPWFAAHWWQDPYTHLRLLGKPTRVYWGHNVLGTPWKIKEVAVGDKVFWTVLERKETP